MIKTTYTMFITVIFTNSYYSPFTNLKYINITGHDQQTSKFSFKTKISHKKNKNTIHTLKCISLIAGELGKGIFSKKNTLNRHGCISL